MKIKDKINDLCDMLRRPASITRYTLTLSILTLILYHTPLFRYVTENVEHGINGVVITASFALLMVVVNFLVYTLLVYLCRGVGKALLTLLFLINGLSYYFVANYEVLLTRDMMANVFNTRYSEASAYFSIGLILYVILFGILPSLYIWLRRVERGTVKRLMWSIVASIAIIAGIAAMNINNILWIDRNATTIGSLVMPWSYIANTVRHFNHQHQINRKEIPLPDATITTEEPAVLVLVIGESARSHNFSLYGYERTTNPLLANDDITTFKAVASATSTTRAVKAIIEHTQTNELYEILPNYLYRTGVDVLWRTANWGEPPLHIADVEKVADLKVLYPEADARYDGILLEGLSERIEVSTASKMLIVLHTSTSHGPTYYKKYPAEFERFTPVCTTVEMASADRQELINAYDNTILYTDYLLHSLIDELRQVTSRKCAMIYISDHGESLGENNIYMHGMVSASMAPREQLDIPFIVWQSEDKRELKSLDEVGHYNIFHSVMDYLDIVSPIYDPEKSIFQPHE